LVYFRSTEGGFSVSKKLARFLFAFFVLCSVTIPCFALPLPDGDFNRQQAIDTFFKDKPESPLEGIWITDDNKYEIAIVKNDFSICPGYDYLGFTVQTTDLSWDAGKIKLQLKATAIPKLFTGLWHKRPNSYLTPTDDQSLGTTFRIAINHMMEYTNERREKKYLYRIYPGNADAANANTHSGTGFFVASDLIVTNYHVIANCQTIEIKYNNGQKVAATVIAKDPINDLALLKVSKIESSVNPLSIANSQSPKDGDTVYTVGFPMPGLLGTKAKLSEGIINSITGVQDDVRMFQISIPIQPGNSGGPLINSRGQVVGIVTATVNPYISLLLTGTFPQNVSFAMKINYLNNLLNTLPAEVHLPDKNAYSDLSPGQIMVLAKDAVVQVEGR
jgi:S1-C subfamily serine protease